MIINPNFPSGYVVFCDDVRQEITGKTTQVGIYNGHMILFGSTPVVLPQLCAVITLRFLPPKVSFRPIFKIFQTGREEAIYELEGEVTPVEALEENTPLPVDDGLIRFHSFYVLAQLQGLTITEACSLKVRAFIGQDEIRLGTLQIIVASPEEQAEQATATS